MNVLLILPHHLFQNISLKPYDQVVCIEEPILFYDAVHRPIKVHKLRLAHMRASLKAYHQSIAKKHPRTNYVDWAKADAYLKKDLPRNATIYMEDPVDHDISAKYVRMFGNRFKLVDANHSKHFIASHIDLKDFLNHRKDPNSNFTHVGFFNYLKTRLNVLPNVPSFDASNRQPLPRRRPFSATKQPRYDRGALKAVYAEAITYVETHPQFKQHYGTTEMLSTLPITHSDATAHWHAFLRSDRFRQYGTYQDAISAHDPFVYHSNISALLNNGLLDPRVVLQNALAAKGVPMNSKEGFVRQLLGWREYMRLIYRTLPHDHPTHKLLKECRVSSRLKDPWYRGTTGFTPFDGEVAKLYKYAYAHHIIRLMVFLNLMKLSECSPAGIYKWFMEMVAIDAYDWVMVSNLAAMGHYGDLKFMRKPYISSSNYILKMSNYKRGAWCAKWDTMYHAYIKKHQRDPGMQLYAAQHN
jgi:deoxyribodipyrimidine photolyase-related protein